MTTRKVRRRKAEGVVPWTGTAGARRRPCSAGPPALEHPGGRKRTRARSRTGTSGEESAGRQQGRPGRKIRGAQARDGGSRRRREKTGEGASRAEQRRGGGGCKQSGRPVRGDEEKEKKVMSGDKGMKEWHRSRQPAKQAEERGMARCHGQEHPEKKKCQEQERGTQRGGGTGESDRRGRDGVAAEGRDGGRGGGGRGRAKTQRARHGGQKKEGAKRNKPRPWGKESAEEYPSG